MVRPEVIRYLVGPVPVLSISALFLIASLSLSWTAQNSQAYGQWYSVLLVVNIVGILILSLFFLINLARLIRQYRKRVLGSRLMVRFVALFTVLTLLPIAAIYYFAGQFVSKGVDSWFDAKIEQALDDSVLLGKSFLEASKQSLLDKAQTDAARFSLAQTDIDVIQLLEEIRNQRGYPEMALFDARGRIIASSNVSVGVLVPDAPEDEDLRETVTGKLMAKLEPVGRSLQYRVLAPVFAQSLTELPRVLQIREWLPQRYAHLSETLQAAATEYSRLNYLRRPLKISFLISLSMITLMTTLISLWLALFSARRLVAPIRDLAEGTQAVAAGNYGVRIPVKGGDEFGMLVTSFNTMTGKVRIAQAEVKENQQKAEAQHAYLQTVLAHLSSGVMSFDADGKLQTANAAASAILSLDLNQFIGADPREIVDKQPRLSPLLYVLQEQFATQTTDSEIEIQFEGERGGQTLSVGITRIQAKPDERAGEGEGGFVVVFDDVTKLIHAEREAAWGEVARRLAHEIKNPLTPIQLSSERIRNKYLDTLPEDQRGALDRSTRIISEQVEAMKRMVDAFSNYARSAQLTLTRVDLNQLIKDVVDLHRRPDQPAEFALSLDDDLSGLNADPDSIRQILNNLIGNARDATETRDDGQITITTRTAQHKQIDGIELLVCDNGTGYPQDIIDRVFEPYVTNKPKGTGLGMAIVKRIVDRHEGQIKAKNVGGSAQVTIWLPSRGN